MPGPGVVDRLTRELRLPRALCGVLAARGILLPEEARRFLRPTLDQLHDPAGLAGASAAAERIASAVRGGETILVHGDFDVDGISSTALLTRGLRDMGGTVVPFVPHRVRDGYDLGSAGLERARTVEASLLVTCDCGIRAHDAVARAGQMGIDVIVTDHHRPAETLPPALAVVNPNRSDCDYPDRDLCGAGVAFKLLQLVARTLDRDSSELLPHLDLVALATVADQVPLRGENRVLTRFGLRYLAHTRRPGLRALIRRAGLEGLAREEKLDAGSLAWGLGPRINAVGRMGDASDAVELFLTADPSRADVLAERLEKMNDRRKEVDRATLDEALVLLEDQFDPARDFGVVLAGRGWHPGVIGIVASRIVERVHRPAVLISVDDENGRGSGRSIDGVDLHGALVLCRSHLRRFGGHPQAAGLDVDPAGIDDFRRAFNEAIRQGVGSELPPPVLRPDLELEPGEADSDLLHWLGYLGPHGKGNPAPLFVLRGAPVRGRARIVGRDHLKLALDGENGGMDAIGFGLARRVAPEEVGTRADVAFRLEMNEYRGRRSLQARLLDLRPR